MSLTLTLEQGGGEVSGSGTNIELDGTIAGGAIESVEMYGDTEQTTYSGKNLYEGSPSFNAFVGVSGWEDGGTYNGMPVVKRAGAWGGAYKLLNVEAGNTYTFSLWVKADQARQGSIYSSGSSTGATATITPNAKTLNISTDWERVSLTFECSVSGTVALRVENWTSSDTNYTYIAGYQLEVGSSMTSFEPYTAGASPNPDYPQEIQTVTGRQVVTISDGGSESQEYEINLGKNLFDKDNFPSVDGFIRADNYTLTSSATNKTTYIKVNPNTTYTFSGFVLGVALVVGTFNKVPALGDVANVSVLKGASDTTVTITTGVSDSYIAFMYKTSLDELDTSAFQIEKGSATTYAPYFTPIELCKIGTYQDYIYKSGEDWYVHKETTSFILDGTKGGFYSSWYYVSFSALGITNVDGNNLNAFSSNFTAYDYSTFTGNTTLNGMAQSGSNFIIRNIHYSDTAGYQTWLASTLPKVYYPLATPTDTQITNEAIIAQLEALNEATTYDGTTVITVSSENLAGSLEVTVSSNIAKTYTEVEIGSPFTITDVEGKSSNTTLDGNVYVDWAYNKKQYSFDLFNLTPQDYADIRAFYDYQFNNSAFPTITVPELNIDKLPVYMEISSRNIINQCLLTDKLTIKFRETVQP